MAGNYARLPRRKFSFHDMQIGSANAAGTNSKKNMAGLELRICDVSDLQRALRYGLRRREDSGFHDCFAAQAESVGEIAGLRPADSRGGCRYASIYGYLPSLYR